MSQHQIPQWLIKISKPLFRKQWESNNARLGIVGKSSTTLTVHIFGKSYTLIFSTELVENSKEPKHD